MSEVQLVLTEQEQLENEFCALQWGLEALALRVNALEKAHNRLAHYVGHATGGTTVGQDNWAETGEEK